MNRNKPPSISYSVELQYSRPPRQNIYLVESIEEHHHC